VGIAQCFIKPRRTRTDQKVPGYVVKGAASYEEKILKNFSCIPWMTVVCFLIAGKLWGHSGGCWHNQEVDTKKAFG
jgi:hypothetical protein